MIRFAGIRVSIPLLLLSTAPAYAQSTGAASRPSVAPPSLPSVERLVNLDAGATPFRGDASILLDVRPFGASENNVTGTLQLGYGVTDNLEIVLRGVLASKKDVNGEGFAVRHGGTDIELLAKYRLPNSPNWAGTLGISYPQTAAPSQVYATTQLLYERQVGSRVTIHFAPKGVFGGSRSLVGIGGGASVRICPSLELVGDLTGIVSGNNTYSVYTGEATRAEVWALALRYRPKGKQRELAIDLGVTNGLGGTTAMSLTPGLAGSSAVYVGFVYGFREKE